MGIKKHGTYRFNDCELDLTHRTLRRDGQPVAISSHTLDLLAYFVLNPQRKITQEELVHSLWPGMAVEESNLGQHLYLLRKSIEGSRPGDRIIVYSPDTGYEFTAAVTAVAEPPKVILDESQIRVARTMRRSGALLLDDEDLPVEIQRPRNKKPEPTPPAKTKPPSSRRKRLIGFAILCGALVIIALLAWLLWRSFRPSRTEPLHLLVTDFQNSTGDPDFDLSIRAALVIDLRQSPYLQVVREDQIRAALAESNGAATTNPSTTASNFCDRLSAETYLTGNVRRFPHTWMVTVEAFSCTTRKSIAISRGVADSSDGIIRVLDKVAADMRSQLGEPRSSISRFNRVLFPAGTGTLEALHAFAQADELFVDGKYSDSTTLFLRALQIDPDFSQAYEELGLAYANLSQPALAAENLTRAYQRRDNVGELDRFNFIARYSYLVTHDLLFCVRNFKDALTVYPNNAVFLAGLADLQNQLGKPGLALDPARRALTLDPTYLAAYEVLATSQLRLGQFEEAAATCNHGLRHQPDEPQLHILLLQMAFLRLDQAGITEQVSWANGRPAQPEMDIQQGLINFASGKVKAAETDFARAEDGFRKQGQLDRIAFAQALMPRIEAELGLTDQAITHLGHIPPAGDDTSNSLDAAVAWAESGQTIHAQQLLNQALLANPISTLWQQDFAPQVRSSIALAQHHPEVAIDELQPATPYELRSFAVPAMRGRADIVAGRTAEAETEFHKILDHPGIEPLSHDYPLAQLGLARALAKQGKPVEAGFAYKIVLQIWKDADPTLPRLQEAKSEYAALTGESTKPRPKPTPRKR